MTFIAKTRREGFLLDALYAATRGKRGTSTPCNYSVYNRGCEIESELSRDEAIGFARGLEAAGMSYGGDFPNPEVRCGAFIVYPEERYGEIVGEETE